ncbi:MAG: type II toxin-antitoxin system RelE/ParE family toxin [Victivallales bacterium]
MTLIETKIFTQQITGLMGDSEYRILQNELLTNPKAGDVIEHSGGLRKIRFGIKGKGRGKRGGIRIIYFYHEVKVRIYLLVSYSKNEKDDLSAKELEILRNIAKGLK